MADYQSEPLAGTPGTIAVVIRFESRQALHNGYRSPEYQQIRGLRTESARGMAVVVEDLDMHKNMRLDGNAHRRPAGPAGNVASVAKRRDASADGVLGETGDRADVELGHDALTMGFYGLDAEAQPLGDGGR